MSKQQQETKADPPIDMTMENLGEGEASGIILGNVGGDLEEGRAVIEERRDDNTTCANMEDQVVAGDEVKAATVIDVDDIVTERKPPAVVRGQQEESTLSNTEVDFADHISEITDAVDPNDIIDGDLPYPRADGGKQDVPLSRYPDMDDDDGLNYNINPPAAATTANRGGEAPTSAFTHSRRSLESQVSDWMSTVPAPTPLRSVPPRLEAAPGAFAVNNPMNSIDVDDLTVGTTGTIQIFSSSEGTTAELERVTIPRPQQEDMLVQATLVEDGDAVDPSMFNSLDFSERSMSSDERDREAPTNNIALVEAKPLEYTPRTFRQAIKSRWTQFNILLVISLVSVAIALGVMAIERPSEDEDQALPPPTLTMAPSWTVEKTTAPSSAQAMFTTAAPTYSPESDSFVVVMETDTPTTPPTMAPISREDLFELLPEYTKEALKSGGSVQFQAFEWLWSDPNVLTYSVDRIIQRFALKIVLNSVGMGEDLMGGAGMYDVHECDWNTLTLQCDDQQILTGMHMGKANLQGTLPLELGLLTSLQEIDMSQNSLALTIPTTIGQIVGLQVMNFEVNGLTGVLPNSLSEMTDLRELILSDNMFGSTLPPDLGWMKHLRQLRVSANSFRGQVPGTLRHLSSLEVLLLNDNDLSGSLPSGLGDLSEVREMELQSNKFRGRIPESFGGLSNLQVLNLSNNYLSGTVPHMLGGLTNATSLELQGNSLQGTLPLEVCALQEFNDLQDIKVDCNELECYCFCVCFRDQPDNTR